MRLRIVGAIAGGLLVALFFGWVPAELIAWLREWAGRGGPDLDDRG